MKRAREDVHAADGSGSDRDSPPVVLRQQEHIHMRAPADEVSESVEVRHQTHIHPHPPTKRKKNAAHGDHLSAPAPTPKAGVSNEDPAACRSPRIEPQVAPSLNQFIPSLNVGRPNVSDPADTTMLLEVCVDSVESAQTAEQAGAKRLELCSSLYEGGITPSIGLIKTVCASVKIPVFVLVRPRGGDFCFTSQEMSVMKLDIAECKVAGAAGVVVGCLRPDGTVDEENTQQLIRAARPMSVTFHRAFDMSRSASEALAALIRMGVDRVLTSGLEATAHAGRATIRSLVEEAKDRITILAGGGVTPDNVQSLVCDTGVKEVHATARSFRWGPMTYRRAGLFMGGAKPNDDSTEFGQKVASAELVRAIIKQMQTQM